jgi:hypothetical protein
MAGLAAKRLNLLGLTVFAVSDQGMDLSSGDCEGDALLVGTGVAFGGYPDGVLPAGFSPRSMAAPAETPVRQPTRQWRRVDRRGNRLGRGASADDGACFA